MVLLFALVLILILSQELRAKSCFSNTYAGCYACYACSRSSGKAAFSQHSDQRYQRGSAVSFAFALLWPMACGLLPVESTLHPSSIPLPSLSHPYSDSGRVSVEDIGALRLNSVFIRVSSREFAAKKVLLLGLAKSQRPRAKGKPFHNPLTPFWQTRLDYS